LHKIKLLSNLTSCKISFRLLKRIWNSWTKFYRRSELSCWTERFEEQNFSHRLRYWKSLTSRYWRNFISERWAIKIIKRSMCIWLKWDEKTTLMTDHLIDWEKTILMQWWWYLNNTILRKQQQWSFKSLWLNFEK